MSNSSIAPNQPSNYFEGARRDFVAALRTSPSSSILEIGCANGGTGALAFREGKCGHYAGVDIYEPALEIAATRLSEAICGDAETMQFPWEPESFDALILSEVLEHFIDPWSTLGRLSTLLKPGAQLLASSPNIASILVLRQLFKGRFDYEDSGVMDRTHLRWFTPQTYKELIEGAGFEVEQLRPININTLLNGWKGRLFNRATGGRYEFFFWRQIVIHAHKE